MHYVYTKKAEKDGVGKVGEQPPETVTVERFKYLQQHGYVEDLEVAESHRSDVTAPPSTTHLKAPKS